MYNSLVARYTLFRKM